MNRNNQTLRIEVGTTTRRKVEALGLPVTAENFNVGVDMPTWSWESDAIICEVWIIEGG